MSADLLPLDPVTELVARSRALQQSMAGVIADSRAIFARSLAFRAEVSARMAQLRRDDWWPRAA